jgi:hypothetical protein
VADAPAKRRWYQFTLRTLLVLVLLCAVACSWFAVKMNRARRQKEAVAAILNAGGEIGYDYQLDGGLRTRGGEPPTPAWLRDLLGHDFFEDVVCVWLHKGMGDEVASRLGGLPKLERLHVWSSPVTVAGLVHFKGLTELHTLTLVDAGIADAHLAHFSGLTELKYLYLSRNPLGDVGLPHLTGLAELVILDLTETDVSDAGLEHLKRLSKLRYLYLSRTRATPEGVEKLRDALPDCDIAYRRLPLRASP